MSKNEFRQEIERARERQNAREYTDDEAEKIRQKAAKVFEHYESDMVKRMSEEMKDRMHGNYLYR